MRWWCVEITMNRTAPERTSSRAPSSIGTSAPWMSTSSRSHDDSPNRSSSEPSPSNGTSCASPSLSHSNGCGGVGP